MITQTAAITTTIIILLTLGIIERTEEEKGTTTRGAITLRIEGTIRITEAIITIRKCTQT